MAEFHTKEGDTKNALVVVLDPAQGDIDDITTVDFRMSNKLLTETLIDRAVDDWDSATAEATVLFTEEEVETPGIYYGEFVATYDDGTIETFPNQDYITITIQRKAT